jgi:hypothetical protein
MRLAALFFRRAVVLSPLLRFFFVAMVGLYIRRSRLRVPPAWSRFRASTLSMVAGHGYSPDRGRALQQGSNLLD